jgi:hypothetical protein
VRKLIASNESGEKLDSSRYSQLDQVERKWIRNQWSIVQDFFNQNYWKRVWVIQEVASATNLKVLYGSSEISWENVAAAIILWKKTLMTLPTYHLSHLYAAQLLDLRDRFIERTPISLLHAMLMSNKALATDPRDKIFALRGITIDGPGLVPTPNYEKPLRDILSDLTRAMIIAENCLDIICLRSIYPPAGSSIPSWIPPLFNNQQFNLWSKPMAILEIRLLTESPRFQHGSIFQTIKRNVISVEGVILDFICVLSSVIGHKSNPLLSGCHLEQCDRTNNINYKAISRNYIPPDQQTHSGNPSAPNTPSTHLKLMGNTTIAAKSPNSAAALRVSGPNKVAYQLPENYKNGWTKIQP